MCVCVYAHLHALYVFRERGRESRGQSKLTDAFCTLGEEKSKSKYCASPAHTPTFFWIYKKDKKEGKKPKTTNHWVDWYPVRFMNC